MNRSFNLNNDATHEARRTQELDEILSNCHYYLDIHQTKKDPSVPFLYSRFKRPHSNLQDRFYQEQTLFVIGDNHSLLRGCVLMNM